MSAEPAATVASALPAQRLDAAGGARIDRRAILALAAPLMVTNAIQAVLNLTDTWYVGRISTDAVAAMGSIYWLMTFFILVVSGVGLAVQAFVSQAAGSRRRARASQATWSALWATLATMPLFMLVAAFGPLLLRPFGLPAAVEDLAVAYWQPRIGAPCSGRWSGC
ncbi:MAG: MATE family efflux transporter [Steroidobacteraceae bacterium]